MTQTDTILVFSFVTDCSKNFKEMQCSGNTAKVPLKKIEQSFRSVYYFSRIFGLWPFSIARNSNGSIRRARVRPADALWFLISFCLYSVAIYYTYMDITTTRLENRKSFVFLLLNVYQIVYLFFGSCVIVLDLLHRNKLIEILKKFDIFDNEVCLSFFDEAIFVYNTLNFGTSKCRYLNSGFIPIIKVKIEAL